jgi:hypothetical protein
MPYLVHTVWPKGVEEYEHISTDVQKNALVKRNKKAGGKIVEVLLVKSSRSTKFVGLLKKAVNGDLDAQARVQSIAKTVNPDDLEFFGDELAEQIYGKRDHEPPSIFMRAK